MYTLYITHTLSISSLSLSLSIYLYRVNPTTTTEPSVRNLLSVAAGMLPFIVPPCLPPLHRGGGVPWNRVLTTVRIPEAEAWLKRVNPNFKPNNERKYGDSTFFNEKC